MAGPLDKPMADVASILSNTFSKVKRTITRTTSVYNPSTGASADTVTTLDTITTPPYPYRTYEIDDASVRRGDQKLTVPSKDVGSFPMTLEDEAKMKFTDTNGDVYRVISVQPILSGDEIAAYILQLRK